MLDKHNKMEILTEHLENESRGGSRGLIAKATRGNLEEDWGGKNVWRCREEEDVFEKLMEQRVEISRNLNGRDGVVENARK